MDQSAHRSRASVACHWHNYDDFMVRSGRGHRRKRNWNGRLVGLREAAIGRLAAWLCAALAVAGWPGPVYG